MRGTPDIYATPRQDNGYYEQAQSVNGYYNIDPKHNRNGEGYVIPTIGRLGTVNIYATPKQDSGYYGQVRLANGYSREPRDEAQDAARDAAPEGRVDVVQDSL